MIHLEQAVIVEGKYDVIKLSSILDAVIIKTDGFKIFKDKEKIALINRFAKTKGIIILTDSDSAGMMIRNYIKNCVKDGKITNVYLPEIAGKERRKEKASSEGFLGVEGIDVNIILTALEKAGLTAQKVTEKKRHITKNDLYEYGFIGGKNSSELRKKLAKAFDLPTSLSSNSLVEILDIIANYEEFTNLAEEICRKLK